MTSPTSPELLRSLTEDAAGDISLRWVQGLTATVSPDGSKAAALYRYNTPESPYLMQGFFICEPDGWWFIGEVEGLGPGSWDFGGTAYPYLSAADLGPRKLVEVALGDVVISRPVEQGHVLAVFWQLEVPSEPVPLLGSGQNWSSSLRYEHSPGAADREPELPRIVG